MYDISLINAVFAALLLVSSQAKNPGIRFRVTDNGLQYVDSVAIQILEEKVKTAIIPDISGDAGTPIGHISYSLKSIHFNSLSITSSTLKTDATVGLQFQIYGASTSLSGNWHYRRDAWPHISGGDTFDLEVSGITVTLAAKLGVDSAGHPSISSAGCSCSVGSVKIHFHGGASWLYNLFDHYIDGKIKGMLQDKLCAETSDVIDNNAEKALATFPVQKQIGKYADINYSLVSSPNFTETFADYFIKGEFVSAISPEEAPFSPSPLPFDSESDKMAYIWITDYVVNTAGFVYQDAGVLNKTIIPSMLPPNFSYPLNTNTFKLIIPKNISSLAKAAIKENNITGHLDTVKVEVLLIDSAIGKITIEMKLLQFLLDAFADRIIVAQLNKIAEVGFPLPVVDGIKLMNAEVMSGQNYNLVAADVHYEATEADSRRTKIIIV